MGTRFYGEGNIGSVPEFREFKSEGEEPQRRLRLNVYFDNPVPTQEGKLEDRGGFWTPVELWHRDAEHWAQLYQTGMRVVVSGRVVQEPWTDANDQPQVTFKVKARCVGILPYRVQRVEMETKAEKSAGEMETAQKAML
jgi:single-strand DNA-binding protein